MLAVLWLRWPLVPTAAALAHAAARAAVRVPKGTSNGVLFVCVPEMEVINMKYVKGSCQEFSPELHGSRARSGSHYGITACSVTAPRWTQARGSFSSVYKHGWELSKKCSQLLMDSELYSINTNTRKDIYAVFISRQIPEGP